MKPFKRKALSIVATLALVTSLIPAPMVMADPGRQWVFTTNADFDNGTLLGAEHTTVPDQLQLSKKPSTQPFLWVPNQDSTLSKIDTLTGKELARYRTVPEGVNAAASRTTVDQQGNCWVANRAASTVVKIGLTEEDQWVDRNHNGILDTSHSGSEVLPFGQDEAVLTEVVIIPGKEGTYAPGTYTGGYATDEYNPGPRSLAIDKDNDLWAGCYGTKKFYEISGTTGSILRTINTSSFNHTPYGATIDSNGILWSSGMGTNTLLKLNTVSGSVSTIGFSHYVYGIGLDFLSNLFISGWVSSTLTKFNTSSSSTIWDQSKSELYGAKGVACTSDNDVWVADMTNKTVYRYDNNGNLKASINIGVQLSGVAVDQAGKVWTMGLPDERIFRINPATNAVDLTTAIAGSGGHYSYSDMTGITSRNITTKIGTWESTVDAGYADASWASVSWNGSEPAGSSIKVEVETSNNGTVWSPWTAVGNGSNLASVPNGRYLKFKTTLKATDSGTASPILYDLTVKATNRSPVALNGSAATDEDTSANLALSASDPDGDPLTYSIVSGPSHGTLSAVSGNTVSYTPNPNYNGADSFTFKASDGSLVSNAATVSLTVRPVNDPPVAANTTASTDENVPVSVTLPATDVDGDALSYSIASAPSHGTLSAVSGNTVTYTPATNYYGADSFTFKASDGSLVSNAATVSLTVNQTTNNPPELTVASAKVTVNEGDCATNSGTWSDLDLSDNVQITSSVGTIVKSGTNANGTWTWSFNTKDGPAQSQTVTVTATDGTTTKTVTFQLVVNNVAPKVGPITQTNNTLLNTISSVATGAIRLLGSSNYALDIVTTRTVVNKQVQFLDPGVVDTHTVTWYWGDGTTSVGLITNMCGGNGLALGSHVYSKPGVYQIIVVVKDKDGATGGAIYKNMVVIL